MTGLAHLQAGFRTALTDPGLAVPDALRARPGDDPARGFAVYRNNVLSSLIDALAARFPVVQCLLGDGFFRAMAGVYARTEPPRSPLLAAYGDTFADFIADFPPAAECPWLADVARLEAARTEAYHAADADPLPHEAFEAIDPARIGDMTACLHPSLRLLASPWAPARIWEAHQPGGTPAGLDPAGPESVLVARPDMAVEVRTLPPGALEFIGKLGSGATFAEAAGAGFAAHPSFDLSEALAAVIAARIVTAIYIPEGTAAT